MDDEGHHNEISDRNEEHTIGQKRKGNLSYKVAKNFAELCSCSVLCKAQLQAMKLCI